MTQAMKEADKELEKEEDEAAGKAVEVETKDGSEGEDSGNADVQKEESGGNVNGAAAKYVVEEGGGGGSPAGNQVAPVE